MKISKISIFATAICALLFTACNTTGNVTSGPAKVSDTANSLKDEAEVIVSTLEDEEYDRSTNHMEGYVSREEFNEDKNIILRKISELDAIMKAYDYTSWVKYVDQESIEYWSSTKNLHNAAQKLPVKGLRLDSLRDYFRYIFVQARVGKKIDEIRYESKTSVKAVQVREDQDVVYYFFHKIDGVWYVHLQPLDD